jgi:uncharacterized protein (DUF1778 family)
MISKQDTKRYSLRWSAELHLLAQKAAVIKGHESLKSYLVELVEKDATKAVEDFTTIRLSDEDFDRFMELINR